MINQIGKITIYVENQEDAIEFWTKKANFVIKLEQPMGPNMKWVEVGPSEDAFTTFVLYEKKNDAATESCDKPRTSIDSVKF